MTEKELRAKAREHGLRLVRLNPTWWIAKEKGYRYRIQSIGAASYTGTRMYACSLAGAEWMLDRHIFEAKISAERRQQLLDYIWEHPFPEEEIEAGNEAKNLEGR